MDPTKDNIMDTIISFLFISSHVVLFDLSACSDLLGLKGTIRINFGNSPGEKENNFIINYCVSAGAAW